VFFLHFRNPVGDPDTIFILIKLHGQFHKAGFVILKRSGTSPASCADGRQYQPEQ
jgi:hypothetical protein